MRKIFLFILLFFTTFSVFADNTLKLTVSNESVNIGEVFQLNFTIESTWSVSLWDVSVSWIDTFNNLWTSNSQNFVMINWDTKTSSTYSLSLEAVVPWEYEIGPAKAVINGTEFISNTVKLHVWSIKASSSGIQKNEKESAIPNDVQKWIFPKIDFSKLVIYFWLICFFILFFYVLKIFFSQGKTTQIKKVKEEKEDISFNEYMKQQLHLLKKNIGKYDDKEFFERFNFLIRLYVGNTYSIDGVETKTLSELTSVIAWTPLASLFNESYILEYSSRTQVDLEKKEIYIRDFLKLL